MKSPLFLSSSLVLVLLVGDAVCLAASTGGGAEKPLPSKKSQPPRPAQQQQQQKPAWLSKNKEDTSVAGVPRIACVISTDKNGGQSNAYTFPSPTAAALPTVVSDSNTTDSSMLNVSSTTLLPVLRPKHSNKRNGVGAVVRRVQSGFQSTFLPSGYPRSTPSTYLTFAFWSWAQDLTTQLRGVVATQRILEGVGVGRQGATALSALLNYLTRDGCGMAATLLFTMVTASRFRTDVKRWRLFADIMVDVGMTLEVAAVHVSQRWFLPMICAGNACKAICGVAAGACGGAINLHWAKACGSDISDINAKFGAQHTVTGTLGLLVAALFAKSVSDFPVQRLYSLYALLTAFHLFANARCMRLLAFDVLNNVRMRMVAADYFARAKPMDDPSSTTAALVDSSVDDNQQPVLLPTPLEIARREPLLFLRAPKIWRSPRERRLVDIPIYFGVSFDEFAAAVAAAQQQQQQAGNNIVKGGWTELDLQRALARDPSYVIASGRNKQGRLCIVVTLVANATTPLQQTRAYFHALLLKRRLGETPTGVQHDMDLSMQNMVEQQVWEELQRDWIAFWRECRRAGWDLKNSELASRGYEISMQYRHGLTTAATG